MDVDPAEPEVPVLLRRLRGSVDIPTRALPGDAAADLSTVDDVVLGPGQRATVGTGLGIALPAGYAAFVLPRSGLAARHGVTVLNAPGTVDAGYRGEIRVTLLNTDPDQSVHLRAGDRVAQLLVLPVPEVRFIEVERLPGSDRGGGGFGSTGTGARATGTAPGPGTDTRTDTATGNRDDPDGGAR